MRPYRSDKAPSQKVLPPSAGLQPANSAVRPHPDMEIAPIPSRIVIADDNVDAADTTAMLLEMAGYEVRTAYGGLEAIEVARAFRPDLVILDLNMPGMDGWAVARALRSTPHRMGLVALTALSQPADFKRSLVAGFDRHLVKPVAAQELRAVVKRLLVGRGE